MTIGHILRQLCCRLLFMEQGQKFHLHIRYRLLPGSASKAWPLFVRAGAGRFIWNHFLVQHQGTYPFHKENLQCPASRPSASFPGPRSSLKLRNSGAFPW